MHTENRGVQETHTCTHRPPISHTHTYPHTHTELRCLRHTHVHAQRTQVSRGDKHSGPRCPRDGHMHTHPPLARPPGPPLHTHSHACAYLTRLGLHLARRWWRWRQGGGGVGVEGAPVTACPTKPAVWRCTPAGPGRGGGRDHNGPLCAWPPMASKGRAGRGGGWQGLHADRGTHHSLELWIQASWLQGPQSQPRSPLPSQNRGRTQASRLQVKSLQVPTSYLRQGGTQGSGLQEPPTLSPNPHCPPRAGENRGILASTPPPIDPGPGRGRDPVSSSQRPQPMGPACPPPPQSPDSWLLSGSRREVGWGVRAGVLGAWGPGFFGKRGEAGSLDPGAPLGGLGLKAGCWVLSGCGRAVGGEWLELGAWELGGWFSPTPTLGREWGLGRLGSLPGLSQVLGMLQAGLASPPPPRGSGSLPVPPQALARAQSNLFYQVGAGLSRVPPCGQGG